MHSLSSVIARKFSFAALMSVAALFFILTTLPADAAPIQTSLFATSTTPTTITENDTTAVELGVKFRSATTSNVLGIRFYKGPQNTGTHTGSLWSSSGTRLATATLTNESASGWQEVRFASPVAITANTTYVASYFAPVGKYSANANFFASHHVSGILTAQSSATAGGNGVYRYSATSAFPNATFGATNYWVDVVVEAVEGESGTTTCTDLYPSNSTPPTGFGASWNQFTSAKDLLVTATCSSSTDLAVTTGNASTTTYAYKTGYRWTGSDWAAYTLTGITPTGDWYQTFASGTIPKLTGTTYFVGYTCQRIENSWKCGCSDSTCSAPKWQLQAVEGEATTTATSSLPTIAGCTVFPADDEWNKDISSYPVDTTWTNKLNALNSGSWASGTLTMVSGQDGFRDPAGIPFNIVPANQPNIPVTWDPSISWAYKSDASPYAFPGKDEADIQGGDVYNTGDHDAHLIAVQEGSCMLYESWYTHWDDATGGWLTGGAFKFDLSEYSDIQHPQYGASSDAAGMPVFPGIVRYDEVDAGEINHALRFAGYSGSWNFIKPATHAAVPPYVSEADSVNYPPFGMRLRLKADFDISGFSPRAQVILRALKKYGMFYTDNNQNFNYYLYGDHNTGWGVVQPGQTTTLGYELRQKIPNSSFEVVQTYQ